ncbi:MAG: cytochrome d ubiquinol oxidase subunit II [Muribaculaceae bacterium]|nr:cytochrome d ubiquinol oxidase subunit II [Muribaculaceae bacterium]
MTTLECLQTYWWLIVSVLGGLLVFLLFVQGGQSMLLNSGSTRNTDLIVDAVGRKWELTFTTLVTFGGAAFAAFPLFYSTSFGGAYWLWMIILFSFVLQAVSYEYRRKPGNVLGTRTYDVFLFINGCVGCILLGVAVGMFFFGGDFTVTRSNLLDNSAPVISVWGPTHGLEAICSWRNLVLGVAVLFLARTLASLYLINYTRDAEDFTLAMRRTLFINAGLFLVFFLTFLAVLLTAHGLRADADGTLTIEPYLYLHNFLQNWWLAVLLLVGVVLVLWGIFGTVFSKTWRGGIWPAGIGTVLTVVALLLCAAVRGTAFLPSLSSPGSSLTLANASSTQFTLTVMAWVSVLVPFVIAYIWYVWRSLDRPERATI